MHHGRELNTKQQSPFISGYHPELNMSPEIDQDNASYFQEMIGVLRCSIDMVLCNIDVEMSLLSRHMDIPCHGNLDQAFKMFAYIECHPNSKLVMNTECMYLVERFKSSFKENVE